MKGGTRAGVYGQYVRRRFYFSLQKYATVFQAEIYAILACTHEIKTHRIPEKHVRIRSDSQTAWKALKAVRTMSFLLHQCQKVLNEIPALHAAGLYWVPGYARVRGNETANGLARCGSASRFVGPELALGVSRQDLKNKISRWLVNQQWGWWRSLRNTQRQAQELISGPCLGTKARLLFFGRMQSRAVTGFLTGHNNQRRHLHLMGLIDSQLCRKCGAEDETSAHILC
jgi:ribonuclease HI